MADAKITALSENTAPLLTDLLALVDDPAGTPATQKIALGNLFKALNPPEGFILNGKIAVSVATNDLTVAIKGMDGNDPSATNPVLCRIGDTVRSITSALSVTKNDGTNWFNAGGTELATKEIDYFVYLGYNATDGVVIGFARIPYATQYDSFSTTTTDEKYCAISTITTASATDYYEVIGRFCATLSAGAGYTWTVPSFTSKNLIQHHVYETRWLAWTPTRTFTGTEGTGGTTRGFYKISGSSCSFNFWKNYGVGGTTVTAVSVMLPFGITTPYNSQYSSVSAIALESTTPKLTYCQLGASGASNNGTIEFKMTSCSLSEFSATGLYELPF